MLYNFNSCFKKLFFANENHHTNLYIHIYQNIKFSIHNMQQPSDYEPNYVQYRPQIDLIFHNMKRKPPFLLSWIFLTRVSFLNNDDITSSFYWTIHSYCCWDLLLERIYINALNYLHVLKNKILSKNKIFRNIYSCIYD